MGVMRFVVLSTGSLLIAACGAARSGAGGTTPPATDLAPPGLESRFAELEGAASPMDPESIAALPEEAEGNHLLVIEASLPTPERDPVLAGLPVEPPAEWTIGASEEGEEVRVEFLEPEGGQVVMPCSREAVFPEEVTVTWVVRYERRNVRLTEAGASEAIHVTPVAARLDAEGMDPIFWVSSEAPDTSPAD